MVKVLEVLFGAAIIILLAWATNYAWSAPVLVSLLEQRFQMTVGSTRVLPECGCTIRYLGTSVKGNTYSIRVQRLD